MNVENKSLPGVMPSSLSSEPLLPQGASQLCKATSEMLSQGEGEKQSPVKKKYKKKRGRGVVCNREGSAKMFEDKSIKIFSFKGVRSVWYIKSMAKQQQKPT